MKKILSLKALGVRGPAHQSHLALSEQNRVWKLAQRSFFSKTGPGRARIAIVRPVAAVRLRNPHNTFCSFEVSYSIYLLSFINHNTRSCS